MLSAKHLLFTLMAAHGVIAATHDIKVGISGLSFEPNTTTAAVGDTLVFRFYPGQHDVARGDFASPCTFSTGSGGFYSGEIDSDSGEAKNAFVVTVSDTNPIWYYCSPHCQLGMVGVINPPSSGNTLDGYLSGARLTRKSTKPPAVGGGVVQAADSVSASGPSSVASVASSVSSSSAASGSIAQTSTSTSPSSTSPSSTGPTSTSPSSTGTASAAQTSASGTTSPRSTQTTGSGTASASSATPTSGATAMSGRNGVVLEAFVFVTLTALLASLV